MLRSPKDTQIRVIKYIFFLWLISFSVFTFSSNKEDNFTLSNPLPFNVDKLSKGGIIKQISKNNTTSLKINQIASEDSYIDYLIEQKEDFILEASQSKKLQSNISTNISIQTKILNSSFKIISEEGNDNNTWKNDIEPSCGDVNFTMVTSGDISFSRLRFTETDSPPLYGISNIYFNVSSNPNALDYSTNISFDFQIPMISPSLIDSLHTLALEFRFNNGSIHFILSSYGGNFGEISERNITRPDGTNTLYVFCNKTPPFEWNHISYNITDIIKDFFSTDEYSKFTQLETLFCYMITFTQGFDLTLDLDNINYQTLLPPNTPINYTVGESIIFTSNGLLDFNSLLADCTITTDVISPWSDNLLVYFRINVTRYLALQSCSSINDWNETFITINSNFIFPQIIISPNSSTIRLILPSDWTNIHFINESVQFYNENRTEWIDEYILGKFYSVNVLGLVEGTLEAQTPNYLTNITIDGNFYIDELINIKGTLRYPLSEYVNLFFHNSSFLFHRKTLPMVNSTFIFFGIEIGEEFPIGLLYLTINWSYSCEFGIFERMVYINNIISQESSILLHSPQNISIYQFEPLFVNLSLFLDNNPYCSNETFVFLLRGNECFFFLRKYYNNYFLNLSIISWDPGEYTLQIIASDKHQFFRMEIVNLIIDPALIYWSYENLPNSVQIEENISFRLYSFISSEEGNIFLTLSGLEIRIWINDKLMASYITNSEGYIDINLRFDNLTLDEWLYIIVTGILDEKILKLQCLRFPISNETIIQNSNRAYLSEIMKSPIKANKTFFIHYQVEYFSNSTAWYVPIDTYSNILISAFILRDNYVISTQLLDKILTWNLEGDQTSKDLLVLELSSPTVNIAFESVSRRFRIKLESYSEITINNFTIELNLISLGFPFCNLSLMDSINREITNLFPISITGYSITISNLNIIGRISVLYFLEGDLQNIDIRVYNAFYNEYAYNDSITGSWLLNVTIEFKYSVLYTISNSSPLICINTSITELPNSLRIITASLPEQQWNTSISIFLNIYLISGIEISSSTQYFNIIDPYSPLIDYYMESNDIFLKLHAFIVEPDKASGIKNVFCQIEEKNLTFTLISYNHYIFEFMENSFGLGGIRIIAIDRAGNIRFSNYIDININHDTFNLLDVFDTQTLLPLIFSSIIIGGIGIIRLIRKRHRSIL